MTKIHCPRCAHDFVDARDEMFDGDQAICPHCGARHVFRCVPLGADGGEVQRDLRRINGASGSHDKIG